MLGLGLGLVIGLGLGLGLKLGLGSGLGLVIGLGLGIGLVIGIGIFYCMQTAVKLMLLRVQCLADMGANKDCRTSGDLLTSLHFAVKGYGYKLIISAVHVLGLKCELELGKG
jgi:hypothetical protein